MSYEAMSYVYTAAELVALDERTEAVETYEAMLSQITDDGVAHALDAAVGEMTDAAVTMVHARLTRMLPHLADVIALACWPEFMPVPQWLAPGGLPEPVMNPPGAHLRHYSYLAEEAGTERHRAREARRTQRKGEHLEGGRT